MEQISIYVEETAHAVIAEWKADQKLQRALQQAVGVWVERYVWHITYLLGMCVEKKILTFSSVTAKMILQIYSTE